MGITPVADHIVIVIRVWLEDHPRFPLRAVVSLTPTDAATRGVTRNAKSLREVHGAVDDILRELGISDAPRHPTDRRQRS